MINPLKKIEEVFVVLENQPGTAGALCRILKKKRIAVFAIGLFGEHARLYVTDPGAAAKVLQEHGYETEVRSVLRVDLPNRVGALMELTGKLGNAGINIRYLYGTIEKNQRVGVIILEVDKPDLAVDIFAGHRW